MIVLSVFILFTLLLLVYAFRGYSSQLMKYLLKSGAIIMALVLIIIVTLSLDINRKDQRKRMACVHLSSMHPGKGYAVHNMYSKVLRASLHGKVLLYPQEWLYQAFNTDSITNPHNCFNIARRIKVDYLIYTEVDSHDTIKYDLKITGYNVLADSLFFRDHFTIIDLSALDEYIESVHSLLASIGFNPYENILFSLPNRNALNAYGRGIYYNLKNDNSRAVHWFALALKEDPESSDILISKIAAELKQIQQIKMNGKYVQSRYMTIEKKCHDLIISDSSRSEPYYFLGYLHLLQKHFTLSASWLKRAYLLDPDNPEILVLLSRFHRDRFKELGFNSKEALLNRAVDLYPAYERAWVALAELAINKNDFKKAEKVYKRLLNYVPSSMDGLFGLGNLYQRQKRFKAMIQIYQRILEIKPHDPDAYYNLGIAYYNLDKQDEAIDFFQRALEGNSHLNAHYYLGLIYSGIDKKQAIYHFRQRIINKTGADDLFAEESRKRLVKLLGEKESL